jgi:hypothetical protein
VSARDGDRDAETSQFSRGEVLAHQDGRASSKRSRQIPAAVRREVYERDRGRCAFVSADGRRCEASAFLEYDHELPWAVHGGSASGNVRLLCRAHNALHAQNCFGREYVADKMAARRRGSSAGLEVRRGRQ